MLEALPLFMFIALFLCLFSGFPVAFCLAGIGFLFTCIGDACGMLELQQVLNLLPKRIFNNIVASDILIAVPLFILMGMILERTRIAEDLLRSMAQVFRRMRGGLAISVIIVGALMAASTGIVGATVVTMTVMSLPTMLKAGYDKGLATGTIAASGTLGQIIPPSIVLILLGDQLDVSVGKLFQAAMLPGIILVAAYIIYVLIICLVRPNLAPPVEDDDERMPIAELLEHLLPALLLIVLVLGTIVVGLATPTEASGCGAIGALVLALVKRRMDRRTLMQACMKTVEISAMVVFILAGAQLFSLVFQELNGTEQITHLLSNYEFTIAGFIYVVMIVVFILGFFLDFIEICFIVVPIILPLLKAFGIDSDQDLVFIGILLALNLQTSFLTPPFGFSLFYLKGSAPAEVKTGDIYKGIIPFIIIQIMVIALIWFWPQELVWSIIEWLGD